MKNQDVLPTICPMTTRSFKPGVMVKCRFEEDLLGNLMDDMILPGPGCPFIHLCGLICLISNRQN